MTNNKVCLVLPWVEDHKWKSQFHQHEVIGIAYMVSNLQKHGL
jgi:hypothetical protein